MAVNGEIYRREGVQLPDNYIGTHWTTLPGDMAKLSGERVAIMAKAF